MADDLCPSGGRRRGGDLVAGAGITVDRVDAPTAPDELRESDRDVAGACTHIHTAPSGFEAEAFEGGCERPPIEVVAQSELAHPDDGTQSLPVRAVPCGATVAS